MNIATNNKNNTLKIILISLLLLVLVIFISFVICRNFKQTKADEVNKSIKVDESKEYVYYEKTVLDIKIPTEQNDKGVVENWISYDYPPFNSDKNIELNKLVVNINSEDAKKVNEEINRLYNKVVENYTKSSYDKDLCYITFDNNVSTNKLLFLSYDIEENEEFISLIIKEDVENFCGSGYTDTVETYTISKTTGKLYTTDDILKGLSKEEVLKKVVSNDETLSEYFSSMENEDYTSFICRSDINNCIKETYFYLTKDNKIGVIYPAINGESTGIYQ